MPFGKTIKLFLLDADPEGRMICELSNWTGKAYRIPRSLVGECKSRTELAATAVYLLFGKSDADTSKPKVYIGETENAFKRLGEHINQKDFWSEAVVFISKDENLNKAHVRYLESVFHGLAVAASRFHVMNDQEPAKSSISEADEAEMGAFAKNARLLLNTMGFNLFEPINKPIFSKDKDASSSEEIFYISGTEGASGSGFRSPDGFVVQSGSRARKTLVPSFNRPESKGDRRKRQDLIENAKLIEDGDTLLLTEDTVFSSPTSAASVLLGRNANGRTVWKTKSGKSIHQIEESELTAEKESVPIPFS